MLRKRKHLKVVSMLMALLLIVTTILPTNAANNLTAKSVTEKTGCSENPDAYAIYPIPQNITYTDGEFVLSDEVAIITGEKVDEYTVAFLERILNTYGVAYEKVTEIQTGKTNVVLGINGSGDAADTYMEGKVTDTTVFEKPDAYVLDAKEDAIVICGKDTDSVYYGVATLQMMFSSFAGEKFLNAHIEDFASVAKRGYIEGFYGAWGFAERADLMRFAGNYKVNSYVYAAKGDAYHTSKWAELYPAETLKEFEKLVQVGEETKVRFAWSIHLGSFFSGLDLNNTADYEARYAKLIAKLDQLYSVGVRKFDVLNDDFGGGSHATVVTVLNRLNKDLKAKGCEPLVYCPQGYNQAWSGNGAELAALRALDADINIYWTGADVNAPITQETVNFLTEKSNHKPNFWLNYPVNEHAKSGIYLGDITYYARDNVTGLAGFHSNPSRFAYANEVGLYQLAALVWNNNNYSKHANEVWKSAFHYLQPEVKDSYFTIASNVANAPNSSRVPGFNESEYLKEKLANVQALFEAGKPIKGNAEAQELVAEFEKMIWAVEDFRTNCENRGLVENLEPWLKSLNDLAHAGAAALESIFALEEKDSSAAWEKLSVATKYYDTMYTYLTAEDLPGVYAKAGSRRLAPFVTKAISVAKNTLNPILNPGDETINPVLYARMGGVDRVEDANTKLIYDGDETTYGGWQVVQKVGDYYGLDLGKVVTVRDISILQGMTDTHHDIFHDATLQCSEDGEKWTNIDATVDGPRITADGLDVKARYVRYYLNSTGFGSKPDFWTFVREFTVNKKEAEHDRVYTNVDSLKTTPLTLSGAEISVRELKSVQLAPGQYVGIKLVNPGTITGFVKDISNEKGLAFEYSYNETEWTAVPKTVSSGVAAKYVRLINKTDAAVTTNINKLGISLDNTVANPKVKEHNLKNALKEGSFENLFDGDPSTFAWTNEQQKTGQYITVDLGSNMKVYDVQIITADGNPRFYNAEIQLSSDKQNWTTIAKVENDNSVFEVPYRYVRGNGEGQNARYLRIYLTGDSGWYLKLHEIEINKGVEADNTASAIVSNLSGNAESMIDNDIATLFAADAKEGSYVEYRISENTNVDQVTVVQGQAGTGKVIAKTPVGDVELGVLDESVAIFDTSKLDAVTAVRIEWDQAEAIAIHEIFVSKGANASDDIGQFVEPIIDEGTDTPEEPTNIAIGKAVVSSGCEIAGAANEGNVNDGDIATKWDSVHLKGSDAVDDAWIYIDLGEEKQYEISQVVAKFFNKVYATDYDLQVSDDAENWTTIDTITKADHGTAHPTDTFELDEAVTARYVRLFFRSVNAGAAGNGVAITEFEIYGVEKEEEEIVEADKTWLVELINYADRQKAHEDYKYVVPVVKTAFEKALAEAIAVNEDSKASQEEVDAAYDALLNMVHYLTFTGNSESLKVLADAARGLNEQLYTADSWAVLVDALAKADAVLADENALQAEIDVAREALQAAMDALEENPVDRTKLQKLVDKSKKYEDAIKEYTPATADLFKGALAHAKDVLAKNDAAQEEIDAAYAALQNTIFGLRLIPNKDKLEDLIGKAEKVDTADYTAESAAAFTAALDNAKAVFADENATEEQVKAAEKALKKAQKELVAKAGTDVNKKGNDKVASANGNSKAAKTGDTAPVMQMTMILLAGCAVVFAKKRIRR